MILFWLATTSNKIPSETYSQEWSFFSPYLLPSLGHGLVMGIDESILRGYTMSATGDFILETEDSKLLPIPSVFETEQWTDRLVVHATIIEDDIQIPIVFMGYNTKRRGYHLLNKRLGYFRKLATTRERCRCWIINSTLCCPTRSI